MTTAIKAANFARRTFNQRACIMAFGCIATTWLAGFSSQAWGADLAPDVFIKQLSTEVLDTIKADKNLQTGNVSKIAAMVDVKVMPHVDFKRMTASAVGPAWTKATSEQQKQLQDEFKNLLLYIYSGALSQITDQTILVKPLRGTAEDAQIVVRSEVRGKGQPIALEYRLAKTANVGLGWKIYNLNVADVWLMETYRSQFSQEINTKGVDGLITSLKARNQSAATPAAKK